MRWVVAILAVFVLLGACGEDDLEFPGGGSPDPTGTPVATSTPGPTSSPTPTASP